MTPEGTIDRRPGAPRPGHTSRPSLWGFGLLLCGLWLLTRPFRDIEHDSVLYTLYALAKIHPESLAGDFFVRLGTQDHYTLFTPLYAWTIRLLGIDHAAALITFAAQLGLFCCCWLLARRFMSPATALLGLGMVLALPSFYGGNLVFSYIEMFVTPRELAEVLVLAATLAVLKQHRATAALCLLAGLLLHPIIGLAGGVLWVCIDPAVPRNRNTVLIAGIALLTISITAATLSAGPLAKFDPTWFAVLWGRLKYLWPTQWRDADWYVVATTFGTLLTGATGCTQPEARRLLLGVLITSALGLLGAMVGGDLLHLMLVGQAQTWRWLWLSGLVAVLFLPYLAGDLWNQGPTGRAAALLLASSWLVESDILVLIPIAAAVACATPQARTLEDRSARTVLYGSCVVLAVCSIVALIQQRDLLEAVQALARNQSHYAARISQLQVVAGRSTVIAPLLLALWWAGFRTTVRSAALIATLGAVVCLAALPYGWSSWTRSKYSAANIATFEPWRQAIPPGSEVLWPGGTAPVEGWFLLQRASYWSLSQMSAMVFSKELTDFGTRREDAVGTLSSRLGSSAERAGTLATPKPADSETLAKLCARPDLKFIASWNNLGPTDYPIMNLPDSPHRSIRLYKC